MITVNEIIIIIIITTLFPLLRDYLLLSDEETTNKIYLAWLRRAILPPKQYKEQYRVKTGVIKRRKDTKGKL